MAFSDKLQQKVKNFKKDIFQPQWVILYVYFFLVIVYGIIYYLNKDNFDNLSTFYDGIYFSIVTITTLGYGDILPNTDLGKFLVSFESILGVIILGIFLISISVHIEKSREMKKIAAIKASFKEQYKIWREYTTFILCTMAGIEKEERLYDVEKFKEIFTKDNDDNWYKVSDYLITNNNFYTRELLTELELFQRNLETFIMQISIENQDILNLLNRYIIRLYKMRKYELSDSDERKEFLRQLWELMTFWSFAVGYLDEDPLLEAINEI